MVILTVAANFWWLQNTSSLAARRPGPRPFTFGRRGPRIPSACVVVALVALMAVASFRAVAFRAVATVAALARPTLVVALLAPPVVTFAPIKWLVARAAVVVIAAVAIRLAPVAIVTAPIAVITAAAAIGASVAAVAATLIAIAWVAVAATAAWRRRVRTAVAVTATCTIAATSAVAATIAPESAPRIAATARRVWVRPGKLNNKAVFHGIGQVFSVELQGLFTVLGALVFHKRVFFAVVGSGRRDV